MNRTRARNSKVVISGTSMGMMLGLALIGCGPPPPGMGTDSGVLGSDSAPPKVCVEDPFTPDDENCSITGCHAGMENPHPYGDCEETSNQACTLCHGGSTGGVTMETAHVSPPPNLDEFNRRTLAGLDMPWYNDPGYDGNNDGIPDVAGLEANAGLSWLRFINPGDLRIADQSCGGGAFCHSSRVESVRKSIMATSAGILSGTRWATDFEELRPTTRDTKDATEGSRAVVDGNFSAASDAPGMVPGLTPYPDLDRSDPAAVANALAAGRTLEDLALTDMIDKQCGDCHLNMAGANNRRGDFRSSGCTACHMPYADDGRYRGDDPSISTTEPVNPDAPNFFAGERAHPMRHELTIAIPDETCDHCHFGSNRTVLAYHGERIDPVQNNNQDWATGDRANIGPSPLDVLSNGTDEVAGVVEFTNRINDFETLHGFNRSGIIRVEDWNGDGFDDTPADIHFERGLGCVDCHEGRDVHGDGKVSSRMAYSVSIECIDCHGTLENYADGFKTETGDRIRNVEVRSDGVWLTSRLDGSVHFVVQLKDVLDPNTTETYPSGHVRSGDSVFSLEGSYAMGKADGNPTTGYGPVMFVANNFAVSPGFSHLGGTDGYGGMECSTCHAPWKNTCQGCHLTLDDTANEYSNITGKLTLGDNANADFTWTDVDGFEMGVGPDGQISMFAPNMKTFFRWIDENGNDVYGGNFPWRWFETRDNTGYGNFNGVSYDGMGGGHAITPHSIRPSDPVGTHGVYVRTCTDCHLDANGANAEDVRKALGVGPDNTYYATFAWDVNSNSEVTVNWDPMIEVNAANAEVIAAVYQINVFSASYFNNAPVAGAGYYNSTATPGEPGPFGWDLLFKLYYAFEVGNAATDVVMVNNPEF